MVQQPVVLDSDGNPPLDSLANVAKVFSIIGLIGFCAWPLAVIFGLLAVISGFISTNRIEKSSGALSGLKSARFGINLGCFDLFLGLISFAVYWVVVTIINI